MILRHLRDAASLVLTVAVGVVQVVLAAILGLLLAAAPFAVSYYAFRAAGGLFRLIFGH